MTRVSDTMALLRSVCTGRLALMRLVCICLLLFMMAIMLYIQFWELFNADTRIMYPTMADKGNGSSHYTNDDNGMVFAPYNGHSVEDIRPLCAFPQVNPYEPSIMGIAGMNKRTLVCEGTFKPDLTYIEGNILKVNRSKVNKYTSKDQFIECRYRNIYRYDTDDKYFKYSEWSTPFMDSTELPKNTEFVKVECRNKTSNLVSKTFYTLIPRKEQFSEADFLNLRKRQIMSAPKETLNIIMIGMDTLSRNQFLRACNKTYSYLLNSLKSFDLTMHSQLGENTFPNFLPLFAGQSYNEITSWWSDEHYMDNFDLIWGTFEKAGYQTLYAEDWPEAGTFHYQKKGFRNPFARYNIRPVTLAMSGEEDMWRKHKCCAGNQVEMNFLLDYVSRFLNTFQDVPVFAMAMIVKPTHDYPLDAAMFDEHLLHFYQSLNQSGHLNTSLLISFSDHGVRYGPLRDSTHGTFESRTPYTILTFPDWFLRKYADVAANLNGNTRRLTSHFDTHATLLDLLYFKSNTPPPLIPRRHGISLFEKIPWNRTCKDASIPEDFCLCGYKRLEEIDSKSQISRIMATLVIDSLNSKTDKNVCAVFKLDQVILVNKFATLDANFYEEATKYTIKLQVIPGNAIFQTTVYLKANSSNFEVSNDIERLNLYRGQADCVNIASHRPFCYCINLLPTQQDIHFDFGHFNTSTDAPYQ